MKNVRKLFKNQQDLSLIGLSLLLVSLVLSGCRTAGSFEGKTQSQEAEPRQISSQKLTPTARPGYWHFYSWVGEGESVQSQWTQSFHSQSQLWGSCLGPWVLQESEHHSFEWVAQWKSRSLGSLESLKLIRMEPANESVAQCLERVIGALEFPSNQQGQLGVRSWDGGLRQSPFEVEAPGLPPGVRQ